MINVETLLRRALPHSVRIPYSPPPSGQVDSAVLAIFEKDGDAWNLLFTRRGRNLADHSGQISFPGGRADAGDSGPAQTALREACEEVGLPSSNAHLLGILDPVETTSRYRVWPAVCVLRHPAELAPSPPEVEEVFRIPLDWLMREGRWEWRPVESRSGESGRRAVFFEPYHGHVLWGATALIVCRLVELIRKGQMG